MQFDPPASSIAFDVLGIDSGAGSTIGDVEVYAGTTLLGTETIVATGGYVPPVHIDLSAYDDVTEVRVVDPTDGYGVAYDDLSFVSGP